MEDRTPAETSAMEDLTPIDTASMRSGMARGVARTTRAATPMPTLAREMAHLSRRGTLY